MQTKINSLLSKIGKLILSEVLQPLEEIKTTQREQGEAIKALAATQKENSEAIKALTERVEKLHEVDPIITECDLASLDNQICTRIAKCRERRYTTAEDRRIVGRMHRVYQQRGGNHGEENEYAIFCQLPTEEAYSHEHGGN